MKKKISLLFLIMLLAMGTVLSACNSKEGASEESEGSKNSEASTGDKDPLGKYDETVTVRQVIGFGNPEDPKTPQGTTPQSNAYVAKLKEMLNIDLKFDWEVPSEQFEQKFSLALASGDIPDVMQVSVSQFEKFKQQGVLADLTDAYNDYASDTIKSYMEFDGGKTLDLFTQDGKILGIPGYEDPYMSAQFLWIRKDWLDNLKLDVPTSLEELEQVAQAFVDQDPNGDGKNNTYGVALNKELITWGYDARGLFYTMGAYPKAWTKGEDGSLIPGEIQPQTKEALGLMNSWYDSGIIDKEFAFKDMDKVVEDIVSGKVGIVFGEWWYPGVVLGQSRDNDPNADWIPLELPTYKGQESKTLVPASRITHVVVANKDFEHPEAAIKMINFYDELQKPEYEENKPENGYVYNWFQPRIYRPDNIQLTYNEVNEALDKNLDEIDSSNPISISVFKDTKDYLAGDETKWGNYFGRAAQDGGWATVEKIREKGNVVYNEFAGASTPTMVSKGSSLDKLTDETFTKIIMGSDSIDNFDKYVEDWKKLGGDKITEEVNEWYKEK
ncbi:extracellular solute-binding protein [Bacillus niameyensis]|uniref:extracellular solute-binding protein n=1 Tax=Bacillus niameyensis TaxID=1522308 RepID=UPI0007828449|nr:extracellular solute-binding protein [Bacillus niameyensis]